MANETTASAGALRYVIEEYDTTCRVVLNGEMSMRQMEAFRPVITRLRGERARKRELCLAGLTRIDMGGVGMMLHLTDRLRRDGQCMTIRNVPAALDRVLGLSSSARCLTAPCGRAAIDDRPGGPVRVA